MFIKFLKVTQVFFLCFLFLHLFSNSPRASENRIFATTVDNSPIIYGIDLVKDTLLSYEPLLIEIWLKNISNRRINLNFAPLMGWTIKSDDGKSYPPHIGITPGLLQIAPGDSLNWRIDLIGQGITSPNLAPEYFPEGSYKLTYWQFGDSIPPLRFIVTKPIGEEADALELLLKSFPSMKHEEYFKLSTKEFKTYHEDRIRNLIQVADRYPRSVYAAKALSGASISAWSVDRELAYRLNLRVLNEYSDPFKSCFGFLSNYYETKKDSIGFRFELGKIIDSSSDSGLVTRAKRYLQGMAEKK